MGGMIVQEYALAYPEDLRSVIMACTYAAPGPFCSRMFAMWADAAPVLGIPFVMRDVTLWAFTTDFFSSAADELAEFETAMAYMDQPVPAYLAQLAVIQQHDTTDRLGRDRRARPWCSRGSRTSSSRSRCPRNCTRGSPESEWQTVQGGHACLMGAPGQLQQRRCRLRPPPRKG